MHSPGIEPESNAWKALMLPLHQECYKSQEPDLNQRPMELQSTALPTELS